MEMAMPLQQYVRQVKPRNESYTPAAEKIQSFLVEGFTTPISTMKDISSFSKGFEYTQVDLNKLVQYLKDLRLGPPKDLAP